MVLIQDDIFDRIVKAQVLDKVVVSVCERAMTLIASQGDFLLGDESESRVGDESICDQASERHLEPQLPETCLASSS